MAQWISIEEAAAKYGFETEYIWVLIEMREITVDYERPGIDIISDDSVQEFMSRNERGATLMYIEKLERYCIDKSKLCSIYLSLLGKHSMLLNNRDREHQQPVKLLYGSLQLYKKLQVLLFFL